VIPGRPPAADSLRATLDSVFSDPAYRWVDVPHPFAFLGRWWNALRVWLEETRQLHPDAFQLLIWALVVVLVAILVHGAWVLVTTVRAAGAPPTAGDGAAPEVHGADWYRQEAARLARAGRYVEAMQADFLALVLDLDQRRVLRFHPSKTPREYTVEARLPPAALERFRALVRALYRYAFAGEPCGEPEFTGWRELAAVERHAGPD
jgi:hypothetical protein